MTSQPWESKKSASSAALISAVCRSGTPLQTPRPRRARRRGSRRGSPPADAATAVLGRRRRRARRGAGPGTDTLTAPPRAGRRGGRASRSRARAGRARVPAVLRPTGSSTVTTSETYRRARSASSRRRQRARVGGLCRDERAGRRSSEPLEHSRPRPCPRASDADDDPVARRKCARGASRRPPACARRPTARRGAPLEPAREPDVGVALDRRGRGTPPRPRALRRHGRRCSGTR